MNEFPKRRMRRLRRTPALRKLVRETELAPAHLIQPLFVVEDDRAAGPIAAMPGVARLTLDGLPARIEQIRAAGVPAVLLFGIPATKSPAADAARRADGIVPRAVRACRDAADDLAIITDVCVCSYTDHGHCGVVTDGAVDNDASLGILAEMAVSHARAGADLVAPSAMMDGQVAALRGALDAAGFAETGILSYAVKYASSFYGPFREAADSTPGFGDRRAYQMDPANAREALAEAELDVAEGADALMVKPALPYLDVVAAVRQRFPQVPLAAYQVSGEYAMIAAAAANGWLDERLAALEALTAIRRAGADWIITYYADRVAGWRAA
ncbi:MAG TPA: porphobilinogen synthase [Phycisphaerae bacterium]|nr:porphobilinogen synthase [Phycisphaerales bacterium]HRX84027.1 porphobilinogen synthase [Phycisphaerae bacterium]